MVPSVFELFLDPPTDVKPQVRRDGDVAAVKQSVNITTHKLTRAFGQLQSDAALVKRIAEMGAELNIVGPAEFGKVIDRDRSRYGKIVAEGNFEKLN